MKNFTRSFLMLAAAIMLLAVFTAGCSMLSEAPNTTPSVSDTPAGSDSSSQHAEPENDAPADVPTALTLPILDEIDTSVAAGESSSSPSVVQAAVKLLDWGVNTGLDTDEIGEAASAWLDAKGDGLTGFLQKLEPVDDTCQKLLTDGAQELLDKAGCTDIGIIWGSAPVEPVEAIMRAAGLRG